MSPSGRARLPRGVGLLAAGAVAALLCGRAAPAAAHVAPSIDDNNRYLKLTPMGDRVRLAYTVFYGEVPGAALRKTIDRDRDGTIGEAESQAFASRLADELLGALAIEIDGAPRPVRWAQVVVGMGTPATAAGTFSIDLVAWLCLPSPRGAHELRLIDRLRLPHPGETEVKIEDSPGVTIERARLGNATDPSHDFKLVGAGGPLADTGLELRFTAGATAAVGGDGACEAPPPPRAIPAWGIVAVAAAIGAGLAWLVARRSRRPRRPAA